MKRCAICNAFQSDDNAAFAAHVATHGLHAPATGQRSGFLSGPLNLGCLLVLVVIAGFIFLNATTRGPQGTPSQTCVLVGVPGGASPTTFCHD